MEIVVETEAEAGASGYSVTGGGQRGIFVKDVLRDSPAAKHLSLQEGDQLLSAKVYFDNVKYEDALKILQCAEPYKVSFQLKRIIPGLEICVRPRVPIVEVKGPKAKVAKMSVKGSKQFKAKKMRGGRFGLKRLKEKRREELVIEGQPTTLEMSDVDVEFSLPKFKPRKSTKAEAEGAEGAAAEGKAKRRIRFPHMKTKVLTGDITGGKVETEHLQGEVNISPPEIPGAKVKTKVKGHKFGINFPKSKHTKSGSALETGSVELKPPGVNIQPLSVEFSLSGDKNIDMEMGGVKLNTPDVEFALPSGKAEASLPAVKGEAKIKAPKINIKGGSDAEATSGQMNVDSGNGDAKLRMPKLKLPKVRLSRHSDEIDGEIKVKAKGMNVPQTDITLPKVELKGGGKINLPEANISKSKMEVDLSGNAASVEMPSLDISLPHVKGKSDMKISLPKYEGAGKTAIKMPAMDISGPEVDLEFDTGCRIPDEVEGTFTGPKISRPKVDISLPKMGPSNVNIESPEGGGQLGLPSVDIALPKVEAEGDDVDMHYFVGGDGKFKMPEFDISLPKMKSPEGEVHFKGEGFKLPMVDLILPEGKTGTTDVGGGGAFQLPTFDISIPKMKTGEVDIEGPEIKGGKIKMPTVDISVPKGTVEEHLNIGISEFKGGKFNMPSVDISLPKVEVPEGDLNLECPKLPNVDYSLPTANLGGNMELESSVGSGAKFKLPTFEKTLPKMKYKEGKVNIQGPDIKGGTKFNTPSLDVSLPKIKMPEGNIGLEGHSVDISLPKGKVEVSLPTIKSKKGDIKIKGSDNKAGEMKMPTIEISTPPGTSQSKFTAEGEGRGGELSLRSADIALPAIKIPEGDVNLQGPKVKGRTFQMPKINFSFPKGKAKGDIDIDVHSGKDGNFEIPSYDIGLPKGKVKGSKLKGGKINMPDIDLSLPKGKADLSIEGPEAKGRKLKTPTFDVSLLKMKLPEGNVEIPKVDISLPKGKIAGDVDMQGPEIKGDMSLPKMKSPEVDISLEGPDVRGGKFNLPTVDISLPKGNLGGDLDVE
ncbi:neuroblast differentiation-associated protein AHNAK, partial [Notothenia coriiceps]|uniref:Neuroblast differentiation-associated protein AHNAK n=1 Tax=Notothenia coriiceps TaxID=8208 RepID=A0A6I9P995_9TELE